MRLSLFILQKIWYNDKNCKNSTNFCFAVCYTKFIKRKEVIKMCLTQTVSIDLPLSLRIADELKRLGVPTNTKGYHYVAHAIELCCNDPSLLSCITTAVYPIVAKDFDTTVKSVEKLVRYTIELTFEYGDINEIYSLFGDEIDFNKGKATNGKIIIKLVRHLYSQC